MAARQQQQQQQTEKLIEEMLGFLDSSSDEDEEEDNNNSSSNNAPDNAADEQEQAGATAAAVHKSNAAAAAAAQQQNRPPKKEKKAKNSIAKALKKTKAQFPVWVTKEIVSSCKSLTDPVWHEDRIAAAQNKDDVAAAVAAENDWNSKLEFNCRRRSNAYVQEVHRAIYSDTAGHPPNGSPDYFQAAQNYAIYGKDFLDFPENLAPLLSGGCGDKCINAPPEIVPFISGYGNGLYPTPIAPEMVTGVGFSQYGQQQSITSAAATAAYYQMCNGMQPRPATGSTATYGMIVGNKVTYVAAAPTPQPLVYNQHSSTTTNFISNSLANAALASSPAILYSNPMLTTTTQQYLNTFFKETQYLSGGSAQGTTVGTTTGIYERLVYAQMLQQQIYHQTQQQAAAVAAMFQHKSRPTRASNGGAGGVGVGGGVGAAPQVPPPIPTQQQPQPPQQPQPTGLNLCGRQAAMSAANAAELLAATKATGVVDIDITAPLPLAD